MNSGATLCLMRRTHRIVIYISSFSFHLVVFQVFTAVIWESEYSVISMPLCTLRYGVTVSICSEKMPSKAILDASDAGNSFCGYIPSLGRKKKRGTVFRFATEFNYTYFYILGGSGYVFTATFGDEEQMTSWSPINHQSTSMSFCPTLTVCLTDSCVCVSLVGRLVLTRYCSSRFLSDDVDAPYPYFFLPTEEKARNMWCVELLVAMVVSKFQLLFTERIFPLPRKTTRKFARKYFRGEIPFTN